MAQNPLSQQLLDIKLALAVLSVQLDAMAARQSGPLVTIVPKTTEMNNDRCFALRAVLAMRHPVG